MAVRRKLLKLCFLYRLTVGDYTFSDAPLQPRNLDPRLRGSNSCLISQPFAKSSSFVYSYFPHTISLWNSLPLSWSGCFSWCTPDLTLSTARLASYTCFQAYLLRFSIGCIRGARSHSGCPIRHSPLASRDTYAWLYYFDSDTKAILQCSHLVYTSLKQKQKGMLKSRK